jgi:hypothetical protein
MIRKAGIISFAQAKHELQDGNGLGLEVSMHR